MLISAAALLLSGCVNTELSNAGKAYNPQTDARIRLYGQNGRYTEMEVKQDGKTEKVNVLYKRLDGAYGVIETN